MEFNEDKVRKITAEILIALGRLEDLQKLPEGTFIADPQRRLLEGKQHRIS
ncbi:MAG: hypothetical protein ACXWMH_02385 [Syntrophales bacterium]